MPISRAAVLSGVLLAALGAFGDALAQHTDWIAHGPGGDDPTFGRPAIRDAIAFDPAGNSYVASTVSNGVNDDVQLTCRDAAGNVAWRRLHNGAGNDDDEAVAVSIDAAGDIVVAGHSRSVDAVYGDVDFKIFIVNYSPDGERRWIARYGDYGENLRIVDVGRDGQDNLLVLANQSTFYALLLKFGADGGLQWQRDYRHNESGEGTTSAVGLAMDATGNALICVDRRDAWSPASTATRYATLKYDPAGTRLWEHRSALQARCGGIAVDAAGRSVVAGSVGNDWLVTQRDGQGSPLWEVGVPRGSAWSVQERPHIIATADGGSIASLADAARLSPRVRFGPAGNVLWTQDVAATIDSQRVVADGSGGHYVVTTTGPTVQPRLITAARHDAAGSLLWSRPLDAVATSSTVHHAVLSRAGGLAIAGADADGPETRLSLRTFSASGLPGWSVSGERPERAAQRMRPAQGDNGPPGTIRSDNQGGFWVSSLVPSGTTWQCRLDHHGNLGQLLGGIDEASAGFRCPGLAFEVDGNGHVYVTSKRFERVAGEVRSWLALTKYDPAGTMLWTQSVCDCEMDAVNAPAALALARNGDPYVLVTRTDDSRLMRYDGNGNRLWHLRPVFAPSGSYYPSSLLVDGDSSVVLGGYVVGGPSANARVNVKYSATGVRTWGIAYGDADGWTPTETSRVLGADGSLFIAGHASMSSPAGSRIDALIRRFDGDGKLAWTRRWNGPGNGFDYATTLAVDSSGSVVVAGVSESSEGYWAMSTIKYDAAGVEQWARWQNADNDARAAAQAVVIGSDDSVYVTGDSAAASLSNGFLDGPGDFFTVKYDPAGSLQWTHRHDGLRSADDEVRSMVVADDGGLVIAGTDSIDSGSDRTVLVKLVDGPRPDAIFDDGFDSVTPTSAHGAAAPAR